MALKPFYIIGVDVGIGGAIAALDLNNQIDVIDMPVMMSRNKKCVDAQALASFLKGLGVGRIGFAVIEDVWGMGHDGVTNAFRFGFHCGMCEAVFRQLGIKVFHLKPVVWKSHLGLTSCKTQSLDMARTLFPFQAADFKRKKDHDRAEAALIAWAARKLFAV